MLELLQFWKALNGLAKRLMGFPVSSLTLFATLLQEFAAYTTFKARFFSWTIKVCTEVLVFVEIQGVNSWAKMFSKCFWAISSFCVLCNMCMYVDFYRININQSISHPNQYLDVWNHKVYIRKIILLWLNGIFLFKNGILIFLFSPGVQSRSVSRFFLFPKPLSSGTIPCNGRWGFPFFFSALAFSVASYR